MKIDFYNLRLEVDFERGEVLGREEVRIRNAEGKVEFDAVGMEIESVSVNGKKSEFTHRKEEGKLEFSIQGSSDVAEVEIIYRKRAEEKSIFGFFKSRYDGKYMLVTDFEPDGARTFFPCKDDPSYKASFRVEVKTRRDKKVISNMPVEYVEYEGDNAVHHFYPTPPMSTYLLFVGIGDFNEFTLNKGGIDFIAASRFGERERHSLTLEVMSDSVLFFSQYFGINYPFKKLHWVALPEYITGAMENWGAITSRERILVHESSAVSDKISSASTVVHEVAHQWFGDLVTMKWWDDLWLNESFASFMELVCLSRLHPEWRQEEMFIFEDLSSGMQLDSLLSTHPISSEIKTPEEAHQIFDAISYSKGASILRMIQDFLGEEAFRKGVSEYLKNFSYGNATRYDFWTMLSKGSGKDVNKIMEAWVTKPGYPVLTVDYDGNSLLLKQERFTYLGTLEDSWPIPLTMYVDGNRKEIVFSEKEGSVKAGSVSGLRVNIGRKGFYRVKYSEDVLKKVLEQYNSMEKEERFGLLDDYFSFLLARIVSEQKYIDILRLAVEDDSWLVSISASDQLFQLRSLVGEKRKLMETYLEFHRKKVAKLGLSEKKGEEPPETVLRGVVSYRLALSDMEFAQKLSREMRNFESVSPNMRKAVLVGYVSTLAEASFQELVKRIRESKDEPERSDLYMALAMSRDGETVRKTLDMIKESWVSRSDTLYPIVHSSMNPYARNVLWNWIKENNQFLKQVYSDTQQLVSIYRRVLPKCGIGNEKEVSDFIDENFADMKIASSITKEMLKVYSRASKLFS